MSLLAVRSDQLAEMNITPLVDVMLVLLVIFMIAAPALTRDIALDSPRDSIRHASTRDLRLHVTAGDQYLLDGEALSLAQLETRLRESQGATAAPPLKLELAAEPDSEYQSVARTLAAARNAGVAHIVFAER
jgi:biopolymer transport protein ExbD